MFDTKMNIETSGYPIRRLFISDKVKEIYLYMKRTSVAEPEVAIMCVAMTFILKVILFLRQL